MMDIEKIALDSAVGINSLLDVPVNDLVRYIDEVNASLTRDAEPVAWLLEGYDQKIGKPDVSFKQSQYFNVPLFLHPPLTQQVPDCPCGLVKLKAQIAAAPKPEELNNEEPSCNPHPDAPHGFNRNGSHNAGRYVCDCEGWEPEEEELK